MTETARSTLLSSAANAALMFPVLSSAQIARIASHGVIRPITCGEVNGSSSLENDQADRLPDQLFGSGHSLNINEVRES